MTKKVIPFVIIIVVLIGAVFIMMRRSHMMGAASQVSAGGLIAVSADGTPMPTLAAADKLPDNTALQESNGLRVSLALNPYPPSGTQSSDFDVTLNDANGKAISDANISLDLTMPAMWMPLNQLSMQPAADGKYRATGHFTMRGLWRIEVIITRGSQTQSVFFDVGL